MANIINGADMMLFVGGKSIGCATNHTLTLSTTMLDTTAPGHKDLATTGGTALNWSSSVPQTNSWTCNSENLFANDAEGVTYDDLLGYWISGTEITGNFYTSINPHPVVPTGGYSYSYAEAGTSYMTGNMHITNLTLNAPYEGKANFTVEFEGNGALSKSAAS